MLPVLEKPRSMKLFLISGLIGLCAAIVASSHAQEALVEEAPPGAGVVPFQFLEAGHQIRLEQGGRVVLGYPATCVHESIVGGNVVIGAGQSEVQGGAVERRTLECGASIQLSNAERQESGASVWRDPSARQPLLINNRAPVFLFKSAPDTVVIEQTDRPGAPIRLSRPGQELDLEARGIVLDAGGLYVVTALGVSRTIEIDFDAEKVGGPALIRFVRF